MDTRHLDETDPNISYDLLKVWIEEAFSRQASDSPCTGWQALVRAFRWGSRVRAGNGSWGNDPLQQPPPTELELRHHIVNMYRQQDKTLCEAIMERKLHDPLSFFYTAGYTTVDEISKHWTWYLYCLTYDDTTDKSVAIMPLDSVDLQVVALKFRVQIVLSRLMEDTLVFKPPDNVASAHQCVHLILHRGLWAPLLGVRPPEAELRPLVGAIVEIGETPFGASHTAMIRKFDQSLDAYIAISDVHGDFPVERNQIKQFIFHERETEEETEGPLADNATPIGHCSSSERNDSGAVKSGEQGTDSKILAYGPGLAPHLRGIADGTVEFQILQELVRRTARRSLEKMMQELAGRSAPGQQPASLAGAACGQHSCAVGSRAAGHRFDPLPTPSRNDGTRQSLASGAQSAQHQTQAVTQTVTTSVPNVAPTLTPTFAQSPEPGEMQIWRRMPSQEASKHIEANRPLTIVSPSEWKPTDEGQLDVAIGDVVRLHRFHGNINEGAWVLGSHTVAGRDKVVGWLPTDRLTVWAVTKPFRPDPSWPACDQYLPLRERETVLVKTRYPGDWLGWAFGERWGEEGGKGVFHLNHVQPQFLLSS